MRQKTRGNRPHLAVKPSNATQSTNKCSMGQTAGFAKQARSHTHRLTQVHTHAPTCRHNQHILFQSNEPMGLLQPPH